MTTEHQRVLAHRLAELTIIADALFRVRKESELAEFLWKEACGDVDEFEASINEGLDAEHQALMFEHAMEIAFPWKGDVAA